jgi:hypothetical protein
MLDSGCHTWIACYWQPKPKTVGLPNPLPIQIQLSGCEVRQKDAERPSSNLLTLSGGFSSEDSGKVNREDILIVDDGPDIRLILQIRLKANGHDDHCAEDGIEAISEARKHPP